MSLRGGNGLAGDSVEGAFRPRLSRIGSGKPHFINRINVAVARTRR